MIQQLGESYFRPLSAGMSTAPINLDQRLAPQAAQNNNDDNNNNNKDNIDRLYGQLKQLWEANPDIDSAEIINHLCKFVAEDGSMPFEGIRSHPKALAAVMERLKEEGGEESPIYATLYKGMGFAVVSNGFLDSFIQKMLTWPEEPEPW